MLRTQQQSPRDLLKRHLVGESATAQVRPFEILVKLLSIFGLLLLISLFFPADGIYVSPRVTLAFPSVQSIFGFGDEYTEAISVDCSERGFFLAEQQEPGRGAKSALPLNCTPDNVRALPIQPIEYPRDREDALSNIMFDLVTLRNPNTRKLVRILHYGDSQLEADRITLYLRRELQKEFGGGGVGYVALNPQIPVNPTVKISMSNDWVCSTPAVKYKDAAPLRVGHLLSSISAPSRQDKYAWIRVDRRPLKTYPALKFSRIKLLVNNQSAPTLLEVKTPTQTLYTCALQPNKGLQQLNVNMRNSSENVMLCFSGKGCPEVCGLGLDYSYGVTVDNIPLRSSSGVDFVKADEETLKKSYELVGAKFIIMQFGANVVPKMMSSYSYYEEQMYEQLSLLKRLVPGVNILVVGVADMAQRVNGVMASYANIEKIRDAQRRASFRAGCAFWDAYQAMGGKNSIVSWAYSQPSLASKDFCHFSAEGATLMAELLYRSLYQEFNLYVAMHKSMRPTSVASNVKKQ